MRIIAVLVVLLLAGCATPRGPGNDEEVRGVPFDETLPALAASFPGAAGAPTVVGLVWMPANETETVLVGVPGGCAGKETLGPRYVPGYSTAHRIAATGRAFVSVDLPGVNESAAAPGERGGEGAARALKAVADALRTGAYTVEGGAAAPSFERIVGFGQSCGAAITELAQGLHAPYDAVVAVAWANGGYHDDFQPCLDDGLCTPDLFYHPPSTDPRIWAHEWEDYNDTEPSTADPESDATQLGDFVVWQGCVPAPTGVTCAAAAGAEWPVGAAVLRQIAVPVLVVLGAEERLVAPTSEAEESARFASNDFDLVVVPATGHVMLMHTTLPETIEIVVAWLMERGL